MVPDPSESFVLAIPSALVVLCTGFTAPEPSPDVTAHITTTPRTGRPLVNVTLCGVGSSFQVQVTMLPVLTTTFAGLNAMFFRLTAPEVGGAAAVAVKVTGLLSPVKVAVTDCGVDPPTLSFVLATPDAVVVLCVGLTTPPPDATAQLTTTPGTAQLFASSALTLNAAGSGLSKNHACASPPFFTSCVAAPGVQGAVPPPFFPPHAKPSTAVPSARP